MAVRKDPRSVERAEPFVSLFPIDPDTLKLVTASMREHGYDITKPVLAWKDAFGERGRVVTVDGHTRQQSAIDLKLKEIPVTVREFKNVDEAIAAAIGEQVQRRNLTREQIAMHVIRILPLLDEKRGGLRKKTAKQLAETLGVSVPTIDRARGVLASENEELIADVREGRKSLLAAYQEATSKQADPEPAPEPDGAGSSGKSAEESATSTEEPLTQAELEALAAQTAPPEDAVAFVNRVQARLPGRTVGLSVSPLGTFSAWRGLNCPVSTEGKYGPVPLARWEALVTRENGALVLGPWTNVSMADEAKIEQIAAESPPEPEPTPPAARKRRKTPPTTEELVGMYEVFRRVAAPDVLHGVIRVAVERLLALADDPATIEAAHATVDEGVHMHRNPPKKRSKAGESA